MLRREIPLLITMVLGWFMVLEIFFPKAEPISTEIQVWAVVMTACAMILGVANVARINLLKVSRKGHDWPYSVVLLLALLFMMSMGTLIPIVRWMFQIDAEWAIAGYGLSGITPGTLFAKVYDQCYVPLQMTMFSLLAWFIASAAFRAFRVRKLEAGLLAVTAIIVMLGRVPLGESIFPGIAEFTDWVMNVPNLAAKRAILIGAALGAVSTGLKVILGLERNFLGGD